MARALNFSFSGKNYQLGIQKLNRTKLYGFTSVLVKDQDGSKCSLATISDDGKHILSKGCVGYTYLNARNEYVPSSSIKMVDKDGTPIEKILSSFDMEDIELTVGSMDDYLALQVKAAYQLVAEDENADLSKLLESLKKHQLLQFKFNYRTDYDDDDAFLLQSNEYIFMIIGQISTFEFVGLKEAIEEIDDDDVDDDFDFGML